ncbi:MAG: N-acetylmuramidase [Synergistaceae bacterium]|nr:N-acetylmuramidase [Synergistaceae bacterium]
MKEFLNKIKKYVIEYVIWAESEYLGEDGSVKREAVIDKVAALIDIPYIPEFVEKPVKRSLIGYIIDLVVDKFNWTTGYDFKGVEVSEEAQAQLAEVVDAPLPMVQAAIASAPPNASVDDKIKALYEQYGIKEEVKEIPQQETIQTPVTAAPAPVISYQWDKILSFILAREGGYSNHPDDKGGETNRGITKATLAAAYAEGLVNHNVVKDVTREDASKIYEARYYKCYGYDKLPFPVALVVTDTTVNHGRGGAAKIVQRALVSLGYSITMDGKWGPKTQAALETAAQIPATLAQIVLVKRKNYYDDIISSNPSQATFKNGWYNRLKALAAEAGVKSPV